MLAESFDWATRRIPLDPLLSALERAWVRRFVRQRNYAARVVPKHLHGGSYFTEAAETIFEEAPKRKPPGTALDRIAQSVDLLDKFTDRQSEDAFRRVTAAALVAGSNQTMVDSGTLRPAFGLKSDPVKRYLKARSAEQLGRDVDASTKKRLRALLVRGYEEGWRQSRLIKEIRELYDGFTYSRAKVIAIYEVGNAYSEGSLQQARDLESDGIAMEKAWATAANPCPICDPNGAAGWIPLEESFPSGHDRPMAHGRCRCSLMTRTVRAERAA